MKNRRSFIKKSFLTGGTLSVSSFFNQSIAEDVADALQSLNDLDLVSASQDENLWARILGKLTLRPIKSLI